MQVGKIYFIVMQDRTLAYRVRVTKILENGIKGKYIPFSRFEVTGRFLFKDIATVEEI